MQEKYKTSTSHFDSQLIEYVDYNFDYSVLKHYDD